MDPLIAVAVACAAGAWFLGGATSEAVRVFRWTPAVVVVLLLAPMVAAIGVVLRLR